MLFAEQIITIDFTLADSLAKEKNALTAVKSDVQPEIFMKSANPLRRRRAFIKYAHVYGHSSGTSNDFTNVIMPALVIVNSY